MSSDDSSSHVAASASAPLASAALSRTASENVTPGVVCASSASLPHGASEPSALKAMVSTPACGLTNTMRSATMSPLRSISATWLTPGAMSGRKKRLRAVRSPGIRMSAASTLPPLTSTMASGSS